MASMPCFCFARIWPFGRLPGFFLFDEDKDENIRQAEIKEELCPLTVRRPTHNMKSKGRWRHSVTTTDEDGGFPSQPTAARRSNKDRANARALAHASMDDQR